MLSAKNLTKLYTMYRKHYNLPTIKLHGPYRRKQDGRKIVILYAHKSIRLTKLYAKIKLEIKLGRVLGKEETVDHCDENLLNDRFSNLQLLSRAENAAKSAFKVMPITVKCAWCKSKFELKSSQRTARAQTKSGPFCSRRCSGSYGASIQNGGKIKQRAKLNVVYSR